MKKAHTEHILVKKLKAVGSMGAMEAVARERMRDAAPELLRACKAQQEAIDRLFALLISKDDGFFPTKSGQPWEAVMIGVDAIAKAEGKI